jgi:hypothetical protein
MMDMCVAAYNYEVNDSDPLPANPTTAEIRQECNEMIRNVMQMEPTELAVNMCVGTMLRELNK